MRLGDNSPIVAELWAAYRSAVIERWVAEMPGTRPSLWWRYDAPRAPAGMFDAWGADKLPEPRRRLGGRGVASHDGLAYYPSFRCGIPDSWITPSLASYYGLKGAAVDPNDPPRYEAQAAYLERHGLLLPGERERLTMEDFEPEIVVETLETET